MDTESAAAAIKAQFHVVWTAPVPFLLTAGLAVFVIWRIFEWRYAATLEGFKERIQHRDDELARLKSDLAGKPPANAISHTSNDPAIQKESGDKLASTNALIAMRIAKDDAAIAISRSSAIEAERFLPKMRAALLTAHKSFGIMTPPKLTDPVLEVEVGRRLLEGVYPMLKAGHIEEARLEAKEFLERLNSAT